MRQLKLLGWSHISASHPRQTRPGGENRAIAGRHGRRFESSQSGKPPCSSAARAGTASNRAILPSVISSSRTIGGEERGSFAREKAGPSIPPGRHAELGLKRDDFESGKARKHRNGLADQSAFARSPMSLFAQLDCHGPRRRTMTPERRVINSPGNGRDCTALSGFRCSTAELRNACALPRGVEPRHSRTNEVTDLFTTGFRRKSWVVRLRGP